MGNKRVIFLDVDGVLNQLQPWYIDINCVKILSKISNIIGTSDIVLTSTWRKGWTPEVIRCTPQVKELIRALGDLGMDIVGRTKEMGDRAKEIEDYIRKNEIKEFIILDDDISEFEIGETSIISKLYVVSCRTGLVASDVSRIKHLVNKEKVNKDRDAGKCAGIFSRFKRNFDDNSNIDNQNTFFKRR